MKNIFCNLLVSSPNGGGLFLLHEGEIFKLDELDTCGLALGQNELFRGIQPATVCKYSDSFFELPGSGFKFGDVHDVCISNEYLYVVVTERNEILKLDQKGNEIQRWVFPGERDSRHINCLAAWNGRLYFSAFGDYATHRGYKGATKGSGFLQDLESGIRIVTGLSQPHSPTPAGQNLLIANSELKELREYDSSGSLLRSREFEGYTRGVCVTEHFVFVGLSASRNIETESGVTAAVVALDRETWNVLGQIDLPVAEVYDIVVFENVSSVISHVARIAESSNEKFSELTFRLNEQDKTLVQITNQCDEYKDALAKEAAEVEALIARINLEKSREAESRALLNDEKKKNRELDDRVKLLEGRLRDFSLKASMDYEELQRELSQIRRSLSWKLTIPVRMSGRVLRGEFRLVGQMVSHYIRMRLDASPRSKSFAFIHLLRNSGWSLAYILQKTRTALRLVSEGKFGEARDRLSRILAQDKLVGGPIIVGESDVVRVLATKHTQYVAHIVVAALQSMQCKSEVIFDYDPGADHDQLYVVICPQMFPVLPNKYVAFQLEQSVSSRWFTDKYFSILKNAQAIWEYSERNIEFLAKNGIPYQKMFYVPICAMGDYQSVLLTGGVDLTGATKDIDVLFYGDPNSPRRVEFLEKLKQKFNVYVASEVFGESILRLLSRARVVVNIHYYENALLETTRIGEALSLIVPVVSEVGSDMEFHQELCGIVEFVDQGDIEGMARAVDRLLSDESIYLRKIEEIKSLCSKEDKTKQYISRFMLAFDLLSFDRFWRNTAFVPQGSEAIPRYCLTLSETAERKKAFLDGPRHGFELVEGVRHRLGWIGCGMSYKYILSKALSEKKEYCLICEDDVVFPSDFETRLNKAIAYMLGLNEKWHVFSGIIAHLHPDAVVTKVEYVDGMEFVHLNKMTSTVMNMYSAEAMKLIANWNEKNHDPHSNTIDRFIESQADLVVVTTLPYLVGHAEERTSTLWGFVNTQYADLIAESEALLRQKVELFKSSRLS